MLHPLPPRHWRGPRKTLGRSRPSRILLDGAQHFRASSVVARVAKAPGHQRAGASAVQIGEPSARCRREDIRPRGRAPTRRAPLRRRHRSNGRLHAGCPRQQAPTRFPQGRGGQRGSGRSRNAHNPFRLWTGAPRSSQEWRGLVSAQPLRRSCSASVCARRWVVKNVRAYVRAPPPPHGQVVVDGRVARGIPSRL